MSRTHRGVVHGNTIQYKADLGLADGQQVDVVLHPLQTHDSLALRLLRCTIRFVALVQMAVAIWWFVSVLPKPKTGTVIHLAILALVGFWAISTRRAQRSHAVISLLNFYLAIAWGIGLTSMEQTPHVAHPWLVVAMTLAIIIPCIINGIAVLLLPRRLGE
jgi:hypothetical protein